MNLLSPDDIKRAADVAARQARERTELAGQQENERRQMMERHRLENEAQAPDPAAAPLLPVPKARRGK
jgi:hypothetical protein